MCLLLHLRKLWALAEVLLGVAVATLDLEVNSKVMALQVRIEEKPCSKCRPPSHNVVPTALRFITEIPTMEQHRRTDSTNLLASQNRSECANFHPIVASESTRPFGSQPANSNKNTSCRVENLHTTANHLQLTAIREAFHLSLVEIKDTLLINTTCKAVVR